MLIPFEQKKKEEVNVNPSNIQNRRSFFYFIFPFESAGVMIIV